MLASVMSFVVIAIGVASVGLLLWEGTRRLMNRNRYFLVVEYKDKTVLEVFTNRDKWRDAFERYSDAAKTDKDILRVVQLERGNTGLMSAGFVFDRIDETFDAGKKGGLTGEAKILTFPKRKDGA